MRYSSSPSMYEREARQAKCSPVVYGDCLCHLRQVNDTGVVLHRGRVVRIAVSVGT